MKKTIAKALIMAAMFSEQSPEYEPEPITPEERAAKKKEAQRRINKAKGLTEFYYGENSLWALNQKTADKKARKKGWINE